MTTLSDEYGKIFAIDSKQHIRQREVEGSLKELFRANIGVVVNPNDINKFEEDYDCILKKLFDQFEIKKNHHVYKSRDIGKLLSKPDKILNFHIGFAREIMNLEDVNVNICFTQLNSRYLNDGKVTIFGKYGRPTRNVDVKTFINIINGYYNVLCGWKLSKVTRLRNCTFILDGMEDFYPSHAWDELSRNHNVRIIYGGDHSNPTLSTADILLKYLDYLLKNTREKLNESTLKKIITYDDKINPENIFYHYIGNPDINSIKPYQDYRYTFNDLRPYIRRPIIFVSKGTLPYQRKTLEELPIYNKIFDRAFGLQASIRIYDPMKDSMLIGNDPENKDYFIPLNKEADEQYELLSRGGANIEEIKI